MILDPHPASHADIISRPLKSECVTTDNNHMQERNSEYTAMSISFILIALALASLLVGCGSSGSSSAAPEPSFVAHALACA